MKGHCQQGKIDKPFFVTYNRNTSFHSINIQYYKQMIRYVENRLKTIKPSLDVNRLVLIESFIFVAFQKNEIQ